MNIINIRRQQGNNFSNGCMPRAGKELPSYFGCMKKFARWSGAFDMQLFHGIIYLISRVLDEQVLLDRVWDA